MTFELSPAVAAASSTQRRRPTRDQAFVLIIDEINRGNLAKVFGELYFLLEYRDQHGRAAVLADERLHAAAERLHHRHDEHRRPLDRARRRGDAPAVRLPRPPPRRGADARACCASGWRANGHAEHTARLLDELNARIDDTDFKIGPSYFIEAGPDAESARAGVGDVDPAAAREHFYGEWQRHEAAFRFETLWAEAAPCPIGRCRRRRQRADAGESVPDDVGSWVTPEAAVTSATREIELREGGDGRHGARR